MCGVGGSGRKKTEIKTHTTFFLPFCPPSQAGLKRPRDAKGPAFLSFFVSLPPVLAPQPGPPPCWARASERKRQEARLWERKQREAAILGDWRLGTGLPGRCRPRASPGWWMRGRRGYRKDFLPAGAGTLLNLPVSGIGKRMGEKEGGRDEAWQPQKRRSLTQEGTGRETGLSLHWV